jgi:deoxycytidine triphosphate deaminase
MSTSSDDTTAKWRAEEIERLSKLPNFPAERPKDEIGVLLSDRIKQYHRDYQLISPFDDNLLRPAGYDLTVGHNYSKLGKIEPLNEGKDLEIAPYQVAVIETYETLNLPEFLIGRWNIRVKLAYKGLLWVGGAQVDPGFRGHLCCPVYNLSTEPVRLHFREELASIDFVTTTPYKEGACKRFDWRNRKMVIFPEYPGLQSGIELEVNKFKHTLEESKRETKSELTQAKVNTEASFRTVEKRIDDFVARIFTVVAVLFTALGIIATRASDQLAVLGPPVWVAAVALWFVLRPHINRVVGGQPAPPSKGYERITPGILVITGLIVAAGVSYNAFSAHAAAVEVQRARDQAISAVKALEKERQDSRVAIQDLRQQLDTKLVALEQQIDQLRQRQVSQR